MAASDEKRVDVVKALLAMGQIRMSGPPGMHPGPTIQASALKARHPLVPCRFAWDVETVRALIAGGADPFVTTDEKNRSSATWHMGR